MIITNPFFHRGPVRDPAYFFGRKQELAQLFDLLNRGQSISISGQRHMGKTSLLYHASCPEVLVRYGLDPLHIRWVCLDGGMLDGLEEEAVYAAIDRGIQEQELENVPYEHLLAHLRSIAAQKVRLVVVFDEFEIFAGNARFSPHLFNRLRGLASQFMVQFVIASKEPLARLTFSHPDVVSSAFFNIFAPFRLTLFQEQDAREMLAVLSEKGGSPFAEATIDFLLELCGPHPHFLQVAAYYAFGLQKDGSLSADSRTAVREQSAQEMEGHLLYYWRDLSADEQYALATLHRIQMDGYSPAIERLAEIGFLHEKNYLGSLVQAFVSRQNVSGLLRHGPFLMDERCRLLTVDGRLVHLTPTEFSALRLLLQNPGKLLTPEDIEASLWPDEIAPDPERARGIMKKLRSALGEPGEAIVTQRGQGYSLM
jgi:hypothetical protein